jgi:ABC-type spermidine/putrescine transport system permease subunit II
MIGQARKEMPIWLGLVAVVALIYLIVPILIVIPLSLSSSQFLRFPPPGWSLQWYREFFTNPAWLEALWNSTLIGLIVATIATVIGSAAAYGLNASDLRGRRFLIALFLSPMIVPLVVLAISLYGMYAHIGLVGGMSGIIAGHVIYVTPLVIVSVMAALQKFDPVYERASLSLGAAPLETVIRVTLPNVMPGILSGFLLAFISSFDDLVISMFVGGSVMTLPRKFWEDLVVVIEPTQAAASIVLVLISVVFLGAWAAVQKQGIART